MEPTLGELTVLADEGHVKILGMFHRKDIIAVYNRRSLKQKQAHEHSTSLPPPGSKP